MKQISVIGGCYKEYCAWPHVDERYGSGGRAAAAISQEIIVNWHYYAASDQKEEIALCLNFPNLRHYPSSAGQIISFHYFHPLSKPVFSPNNFKTESHIKIEDDIVLSFGLMEGDAVIKAKKCVYDPQSHNHPAPFHKNGSSAKELAIVLNSHEVLIYGKAQTEEEAIKNIVDKENPKIILVKSGANGCRLYEDGKYVNCIPPYISKRVYKIGTGDIFSATFAYQWGVLGKDSLTAADIASRCVAQYCETRTPRVKLVKERKDLIPASTSQTGKIYIAGPFFTMAELWLIEEAYSALNQLGASVFSPYHDVGRGKPAEVVERDLKGLEECSAVLAVIDGCDPGTIFEIGYATKLGIPIIALSQNPKKSDLTMILGSPNCEVTDDFSTAVYKAIWKSKK